LYKQKQSYICTIIRNKQTKTNDMTTLKFKTVKTLVGGEVAGYMEEKTLECGSWVIGRNGAYIDDVFTHWAGDWYVERNGETYSTNKTKKECVNYIKMWLSYNPNDK